MLVCLPEETPGKQWAFWISSKRIEQSLSIRGGIPKSVTIKE